MNSALKKKNFDVDEFNQRWLKARISALSELDANVQDLDPNNPEPTSSQESDLIDRLLSPDASREPVEVEETKDILLRRVFDNSRKLAMSLSKHLGMTFEVKDFQGLLTASGIPCAQGQWSSRANARIINRKGCDFCVTSGSIACDYWREALDGLVMGLGEKERFVRHASIRHGDEECVDVFYLETNNSIDESFAWGPVPEHMALDIMEISAYFKYKNDVDIYIKGFREGILYFQFESSTDSLCGNTNTIMSKFYGQVREKFPGLQLMDVTPQAVLGTEAG